MSKDNPSLIQNDAFQNQDDLNDSVMEIIKHGGKIGKLKDDNKYVLDNKGDNF